jgi:4-amino-4-deoxy-L-arabinose transferase-like glycosyltransferase
MGIEPSPAGETASAATTRKRISVDVFVFPLLVAILALKIWLTIAVQYQTWDGYTYLLNARTFAEGWTYSSYFEILRPPFYPFMISLLWRLAGENYDLALAVTPAFTVGAAALLYMLIRERFDTKAALIASIGFSLLPEAFVDTDRIFVHGVGAFFLVLAFFSLWRATRSSPRYYVIVGASIALASLTRYTNLLAILPLMYYGLKDLRRLRRTSTNPEYSGGLPGFRETCLWFMMGALIFIILWLPWLQFNAFYYGDPLTSLKAGAVSGEVVVAGQSQFLSPGINAFFYLSALPEVLTLPGLGLFILGLATKRWKNDERRQILAIWILVFFLFYSNAANYALRFMIEWLPPILAFVGIGASSVLSMVKARMPSVRWILGAGVAIWLIFLLFSSIAVETQNVSVERDHSPVAEPGFTQMVVWLHQHMNSSDTGVTDLPPYVSYYSGTVFYDWIWATSVAQERGMTSQQYLHALKAKYVVFFHVPTSLDKLGFLVRVTDFGGWTIYQVT